VTTVMFVACRAPVKLGQTRIIDPKTDTVMQRQGVTHTVLYDLLKTDPAYFETLTSNPQNRVQIIYSQIDRRKNGKPDFTDHYFNVDDSEYFYPASTVKLPVAVLALQKLNQLKIKSLDKTATMITEAAYSGQTEVYNDPTAADGRPTIEHYIKKILLTSDNDAFNRLYEFLGQEYINNTLQKMDYGDVQIIHRLDISLTEDENRHANPVRFYAAPPASPGWPKDTVGNLIYEKPLIASKLMYARRDTKMGKGFYRSGELVNEPFDFSKKNRMTLTTLHNIVRSIMFPKAVSRKQRFKLKEDDYNFLRKYMSMTPPESGIPVYKTEEYWHHYVKYFYYGAEKDSTQGDLRIFNKVGMAYGFLIDAAYIIDPKNGVEFMLSAVLHCNSDEIFNDNKYEYDTEGYPFMKDLGRLIYQHELNRKKQYPPDLDEFRFDY
jgi:hypothetical protein